MDKLKDYNDNELIYLIKNNNSEEAINFIIEKYSLFIYAKINYYKLTNVEDCYQEGLICLFNAVYKYDENYNKTFNKYFEHILRNRLIDIKLDQQLDYNVIIDNNLVNKASYLQEDMESYNNININDIWLKLKNKLNDSEIKIYEDYYLNNMSPKEISDKYNITLSTIYHLIFRIKHKIRKYVVK